MKKPTLLKWAIILGGCTLATLIYSSHLYVYHLVRGDAIPLSEAVWESATDWYSWAVLIPFILGFSSHFPISTKRWGATLPIHAGASILFSLIQVMLHSVLDQILCHHDLSLQGMSIAFSTFFARTFHFGLLIYFVIVIAQSGPLSPRIRERSPWNAMLADQRMGLAVRKR